MRLGIRADASRRIGTGHVMRCFALAQEAHSAGSKVTFISAEMVPLVEKKLRREGIQMLRLSSKAGSVDDAKKTVGHAHRAGLDLLILDGYRFGPSYQKRIREAGLKNLFLDDDGLKGPYEADFILNQNVHSNKKMYTGGWPGTRLLLGPRFVLLRNEFLLWKDKRKNVRKTAKRILVTLGGSDPDHVTTKVLRALQRLRTDGLQVMVVVGPGNAHSKELETLCRTSKFPVNVRKNPKSMAALMAWTDVAVTGAGSTCWELAFMGIPSLLLVIDRNQTAISRRLHQKGVAVDLGWHGRASEQKIAAELNKLLHSVSNRKKMSRLGKALVDGHGPKRVLAEVLR